MLIKLSKKLKIFSLLPPPPPKKEQEGLFMYNSGPRECEDSSLFLGPLILCGKKFKSALD